MSYDEHAHEETQITLVLSGQVEEWAEDKRNVIGPLELVIKPGGLRHRDCFGQAGAYTLQLVAHPNWLDSIVGPSNRLQEYKVAFGAATSFRFLKCFLETIDQRETRVINANRSIIDMLGTLGKRTTIAKQARPDWLESISQRVETDFDQPLSVRELAAQHDKHPVSVARAFRQHFGVSVKQRMHQLRVRMAAGLLSDKKLATPAISQRCGFADQSHMNRVFKAQTGLTPGRFRQALQKIG